MNTPAILCDVHLLSQIAILQDLGRRDIPVAALAPAPDAAGLASRYARQKLVAPVPSHSPGFINYLIASCPRGVLFPSNDASTELLAAHAPQLRQAGFHLLTSPPSTLAGLTDKLRLQETARACDVMVPESAPADSLDQCMLAAGRLGFPCVLKATRLAGGVYTVLHHPKQIPAAFMRMQAAIGRHEQSHRRSALLLQSWIDPAGVDLFNINLCARDGHIIDAAVCRRLRSDRTREGASGSTMLYGLSEHNQRVLAATARLVRHTRYSGLAECEWSQSRTPGGGLHLYDFNPRASGNIRWVFRAGIPLALQYYRLSLGLSPLPPSTMRPGVHYLKFFYHDNDLLEALTARTLPWRDKLAVAVQDLGCLLSFWRNAIDVLDPLDPRPTLRATRDLVRSLATP